MKSAGTPSEAVPKSAWADRVIDLDASQIRATGANDEIAFCQMKAGNIDQSWMPNWFTNPKTHQEVDYASDFEQPASSDEEDEHEDHQLLNRVCKCR